MLDLYILLQKGQPISEETKPLLDGGDDSICPERQEQTAKPINYNTADVHDGASLDKPIDRIEDVETDTDGAEAVPEACRHVS